MPENKCRCLMCSECRGSGTVWFDFQGNYVGNNSWDDMDDLRACEECRGSGVEDKCDYCHDAEEQEWEDSFVA